jgi:hypothetical protein
MLSEAYELGVDDAVEYVEKLAMKMPFSKAKKEGLVDKARRHGRDMKDKVGTAAKAAGKHIGANKGKYGAGAAAVGAAGAGAAYYRSKNR